jgi:oxalate decarboxylase/phosphoglucose isomerase-like protein (cupin superfamily)
MEDVKIFRSAEIEKDPLVGVSGFEGGWRKKIIYPTSGFSKKLVFGVGEVNPGYSLHRWHGHIQDKTEGFKIVYPRDFEEINYIVSGSGVVQWETDDGEIKEEKVSAGDTIFFPVDVARHQIFNDSAGRMVVVYCTTPPVKYVPIK